MLEAANGVDTVGSRLEAIRCESASEADKGIKFEELFMWVAAQAPELDVERIQRWSQWARRNKKHDLSGSDQGIDLVATLRTGETVAIQCKCYAEDATLSKRDIDSFLNESARPELFDLRWVVSTCSRWTNNAESTIANRMPEVRRIDFLELLDTPLIPRDARPVRDPKPLQRKAIAACVDGLVEQGNERGRLIMACGTGKTFTSLRIAEEVAGADGRVLFAAPSIALVAQARAEWLEHARHPMSALVVCSDKTAGQESRGTADARLEDLACPVTTDPVEIGKRLRKRSAGMNVVFCTYHSLGRVIEAQARHKAPAFDFAIADEAHRTTGRLGRDANRDVDFQAFHDGDRLKSARRLYMTATPRVYSEQSIRSARTRAARAGESLEYTDMHDVDVYGPEFHRVKFAEAVGEGELSDYRVVVLGISEGELTPGMLAMLNDPDTPDKITESDIARLFGSMLALNGVVESEDGEVGIMPRSIAFSRNIARSRWFTSKINGGSESSRAMKRRITEYLKKKGLGSRKEMVAEHLDGSDSALKRNEKRRWLNQAPSSNQARMISNCKVFGEGVDVPALDAVVFLDPKQSHVEIVQAVGRVMRKVEGKTRGYIVVPVVLADEDGDVADLLEKRPDDYRHVGSVLKALQSHDERLAESPAHFVSVKRVKVVPDERRLNGPSADEDENENLVLPFEILDYGRDIVARLVADSGLGTRGKAIAGLIKDTVEYVSRRFLDRETLIKAVRDALDIPETTENVIVARQATLLLTNACLLYRRLLTDNTELTAGLPDLHAIGSSQRPVLALVEAWDAILKKDYSPVFKPALAILENDPGKEFELVRPIFRELAGRIAEISDEVADMGYDHAGPLYHTILGKRGESDGAFYTNNISALMLAGMALGPDMVNWSNPDEAAGLRILDPACGTGTLLMAALRTIKNRVAEANPDADLTMLHKRLVEGSMIGLDVNFQATQLAASNLTLGAPTVDYERMNVHAMKHGPTENGVALGSLEILNSLLESGGGDGAQLDLLTDLVKEPVVSNPHVDDQVLAEVRDVDMILMNPPFTNNKKRGAKFGKKVQKEMRDRGVVIKERMSPDAQEIISANNAAASFIVLANELLDDRGVLGMVYPTTAFTSRSDDAAAKRRFLAAAFHVEAVVTSHDPKVINFSENTSINESLVVLRRLPDNEKGSTKFVQLVRKLRTVEEAVQWVENYHAGRLPVVHEWPRERIAEGDWRPCQWVDGDMAEIACGMDDLLNGGSTERERERERARTVPDRASTAKNPRGIRESALKSDRSLSRSQSPSSTLSDDELTSWQQGGGGRQQGTRSRTQSRTSPNSKDVWSGFANPTR